MAGFGIKAMAYRGARSARRIDDHGAPRSERMNSTKLRMECLEPRRMLSTVALDSTTSYQTMGYDFDGDGRYTGAWEATYWAGNSWEPAFPNYIDELLDLAVEEFNIDRVRLTINSGTENDTDHWTVWQNTGGSTDRSDPARHRFRQVRQSTVDDNGDPFTIDWAGFQFSELDDRIENHVIPLRENLNSRGRQLHVNLNYIAFTNSITDSALDYHHTRNPEEYAEFVLATYLHMQTKYGFVPDSWEVILEPDNTGRCVIDASSGHCDPAGPTWPKWNPEFIADAVVAAGKRLEANGFTPRFSGPSNTNAASVDAWIDRMVAHNPEVLNYLTEISYHIYGGNTIPDRQNIADRASQYGLTTAQLEYLSARTQDLHNDLKYANNSSWAKYTFFSFFAVNTRDPNNPTISMRGDVREMRQYMKYILPGATRIEAATDDANFDPVAFINDNGGYVVVVKAAQAGEFSVAGLPAAAYDISYTAGGQFDVHLPEYSVAPGQLLTTSIPASGVLTIALKDGLRFLTPDTVDVAENTSSIVTVAAADASGGALTYSVSGGEDAGSFVIDSLSGELSFVSVADFENAIDTNRDGVYEVTIMADNGQGGSAVHPIQVRVTDVDEVAPRLSITPIAPANRSLPVDEIHIVFTEAVTGFDLADIQLARSKDQTDNVSLASASLTTTDNVTWVLDGTTSLTSESGRYRLEIVDQGASITDLAANPLESSGVTTWTTGAGDANGDGQFNQFDVVLVLQRGRYLSGQPANWSDGDWNGDGEFDQLDIVTAQQSFPAIYLAARSSGATGMQVTHGRDVHETSPADEEIPGLHPSLVDAALS